MRFVLFVMASVILGVIFLSIAVPLRRPSSRASSAGHRDLRVVLRATETAPPCRWRGGSPERGGRVLFASVFGNPAD
jgi:hypothetical protein